MALICIQPLLLLFRRIMNPQSSRERKSRRQSITTRDDDYTIPPATQCRKSIAPVLSSASLLPMPTRWTLMTNRTRPLPVPSTAPVTTPSPIVSATLSPTALTVSPMFESLFYLSTSRPIRPCSSTSYSMSSPLTQPTKARWIHWPYLCPLL